jgi:putative transposase
MVTRTEPLSIIRQCDLLDLPRSTFYHVPKSISEADLELMKLIDRCHMELPLYGSRRMVDWLGDEGYLVNRKKVQRLIPRLLSERIANGAKTVLITLKACGLLLCLMPFKTICP